MKVVISAPSKYHFFELGRELHDRGYLQALLTGYPRFKLMRENELAPYLRCYPHFHLLYRAISTFTGHEFDYIDRTVFDWLTSKTLPECDVFMGIAASSLWTGKVAKRRGAAYIVDRPCSHIVVQNRLMQEEAKLEGIRLKEIDPRIIQREVEEYETADLVTVPSKFAYNSFLEMGYPKEKLRIIPYGVDTNKFKPVGSPNPDSFDVLYVGLSSLRKGTPHLLRGFIGMRHPKKTLKIVGYATAEVRPMLLQAARRFPIDITGHLPQDKLRDHMSSSHVLVLPSVEDGYGLVMIQAMACGCPVIASENTGANMVVTDGVEGFIVPARDDEALKCRLQQLADDPELRARMSAAALKKAQTMHGWSAYGDAIIDMFRELRT